MLKTKHLTIMFTDMKGFTVRTSTQSRQQLQHLLELQDELIKPAIKHFDGTIVKTVGDAFLVTFESPTDSVLCGMKIQENVLNHNVRAISSDQMEVRIAINSGEVNIKDNDVFGEPVNITSRIESIAEPNEVYFTEAIYLTMNKNEIPTAEVGYRKLKGIPEEIKVYKVVSEQTTLIRAKIKREQMAQATANLPKEEQNIPEEKPLEKNGTGVKEDVSILTSQDKTNNKTFWQKHKVKIIVGGIILLFLIIIVNAAREKREREDLDNFYQLPPNEKEQLITELNNELNMIRENFIFGLEKNNHELIVNAIENMERISEKTIPEEIAIPLSRFIEEHLKNQILTAKERERLKNILQTLR